MSKKLLVSDLSLEYKGKKGLSTLKNITFDLNVEEMAKHKLKRKILEN